MTNREELAILNIEADKKESAQKAIIDDLKSRNKALLKSIEMLEKKFNILAMLDDHRPQTFEIPQSKNDYESESVPCGILSDFHIEETVKSESVSGINKYNIDIARESMKMFFKKFITLAKIESSATIVKSMALYILGDIITGDINQEAKGITQEKPAEAVVTAYDFLISGIDCLIKNTDKTIKIVCVPGNHGRITEKIYHSLFNEYNLEYLMYLMLRKYYIGNKRVEIIVSDANINYSTIYGKTIRALHGWQIRYRDGVGGLTIPALKKIANWDRTIKALFTVAGHFHCYTPHSQFIFNGSGIGYNPFAQDGAFPAERPQQAFFVCEKTLGITCMRPIFVR